MIPISTRPMALSHGLFSETSGILFSSMVILLSVYSAACILVMQHQNLHICGYFYYT